MSIFYRFFVISDAEIVAARFTGDSHVMYKDPHFEMADVSTTQIAFNFSTGHSDGLLLWTGQVLTFYVRLDCLGPGPILVGAAT